MNEKIEEIQKVISNKKDKEIESFLIDNGFMGIEHMKSSGYDLLIKNIQTSSDDPLVIKESYRLELVKVINIKRIDFNFKIAII